MGNNRIKIVREDLGGVSQAKLAEILGTSLHKIKAAEYGKVKISTELASLLAEKLGYNMIWALTGNGVKKIPGTQMQAAGNGIFQGHHIEADEIHVDIHPAHELREHRLVYADPIQEAFLKDWLKLSEVGRMRVWTMLKEEIEREKRGWDDR